MLPNRELDALVAEKVMGYELTDALPVGWGDVKAIRKEGAQLEIPHYSTDMVAAWQVVERVKAMLPGAAFKLAWSTTSMTNPWTAGWWEQREDFLEVPIVACGAETAPLAICVAAMNAAGKVIG